MHLVLDQRQESLLSRGKILGEGLPADNSPALFDAALDAVRSEGLSLLTISDDLGGAGLSLFDACLFLEGLSRSRPSAASTIAAHGLLAAATLARSEAGLVALPDLLADRSGAFAMTEPGGGRGFAALETFATESDQGFRLKGEKLYVTNGGAQALVLVVARLQGEEEPALFLVDGDSDGVEWRHRQSAVGLFGTRVADLVLHDAVAQARLSGVGEGAGMIEAALLEDRVAIAAEAVGIAAEALEETLRTISTRVSFGKPMPRNGTVQAQVADMAASLDGARLLWWQAAGTLDRGEPARDLSAMAKLHAARAARQVTSGCLQLLGGSGCFDDSLAARRVGDARLASLRGGPDELMRALAAREFLGRLEVSGVIT